MKLQSQVLSGKFVNLQLNENNYIILRPDSSFTFSWAVHTQRDIACGEYHIINDTIFFTYNGGILDTICNKKKINLLKLEGQGNYVSLSNDSDTLFRPRKLFLKKDKLYLIESDGQVLFKNEVPPYIKLNSYCKNWYRRKFYLFGPIVSKRKDAYYMKKQN